MNDYLVWVDTSTKIASFHEVEASDLLHFEQYENFMNYQAAVRCIRSVTACRTPLSNIVI